MLSDTEAERRGRERGIHYSTAHLGHAYFDSSRSQI
jgi:hypothetical protein